MKTALSIVAANTGASEEDILSVVTGMIISSKGQHGAVATKAEIAVFTGVCSKYALNPLVKECAAFVSGGKLQIIVMIDGWYKMVNRQDEFDGVEFADTLDKDGKITSITCKMYLKNRSRPICATEYMAECKDAKSTVWTRWPNRMLRHKAYIQAARIAFGISEIIDDDEVNRINSNNGGSSEKDITPQQQGPSSKEINETMAECADLETLKSACGELRIKMQSDGTWASRSAEVIALNVKHKDRINADYVYEQKTKEAIKDTNNFIKAGEVSPEPYFDADVEEVEILDLETISGMLKANEERMVKQQDHKIHKWEGKQNKKTPAIEEEDIGFGEDDTDEFGEQL